MRARNKDRHLNNCCSADLRLDKIVFKKWAALDG